MVSPVLRHLFLIEPGEATLGVWKRTQDYDVWTDCRPKSAPPLTLWEARGERVIRIPDNDAVMHVVSGGVPHHIEGLFGYWRVCDSDLIWFRTLQEDWIHYAIVLGGCPSAYLNDAVVWICPQCGTHMHRQSAATGRQDMRQFWRLEERAVQEFNRGEDGRKCVKCGHLHPPAYRFQSTGKDKTPSPEIAW